MPISEGTVAFCNLNQTELYQGQDTGKYNLTVTLDGDQAHALSEQGIRLKEWEDDEGNVFVQRKFSTKYSVPVIDAEDNEISKDIPRGSKVRVQWSEGFNSPNWGLGTYLQKVRVLELAEDTKATEEGF